MNDHDERLQALIGSELLYRKAQELNIDQKPHIRRQIQQVVINDYLESLSLEQAENPITQEEIKAYYEEHYRTFNEPSKVRLSHILIAPQEEGSKEGAREKAETVPAEVKGANPLTFHARVRKYS
ncbi:MAG: hypothetical protein GKR87_08600 [Kiritimatiellae bacterium]|nr:hypothetical protein [Kiritimatiellia bacterium]